MKIREVCSNKCNVQLPIAQLTTENELQLNNYSKSMIMSVRINNFLKIKHRCQLANIDEFSE